MPLDNATVGDDDDGEDDDDDDDDEATGCSGALRSAALRLSAFVAAVARHRRLDHAARLLIAANVCVMCVYHHGRDRSPTSKEITSKEIPPPLPNHPPGVSLFFLPSLIHRRDPATPTLKL